MLAESVRRLLLIVSSLLGNMLVNIVLLQLAPGGFVGEASVVLRETNGGVAAFFAVLRRPNTIELAEVAGLAAENRAR